MDNKINFTIPQEVIDGVQKKLNDIITTLKPYLLALSPEERQALPKMGDGTLPFVEKALGYTTSAPEFAPPYMDAEGLAKDMAVYEQLTPLLQKAQRLLDGLDDTTMQAGAESYMCSLMYYNSVKMANKMDIPGAKSIYENLSKRFEKAKTEKEEEGTDS